MNYNEPLTSEERQQILGELHRREFLEKQALAEEEAARKAEAQRQYNQAVAAELARQQEERLARLITDLSYSHKKITDALEALQQGDESECYRLLAQGNPNINLVMQRLTQKVTVIGVSGGVPTVRVRRATALGYAVINAEDVRPDDQIISEDAE